MEIKDTRGSGPGQLVLVKWKGLPDFESTWESARLISQRFPEFQLEDKLNLLAGRDGRTPIITYRRRKHKRPSKGTEGGFNSLTLIGYEREEEIRSNGPSEEIGEDNVQSWEGPLTVTTTIKGRTPSARGGGRNRERLPRGEEDLSKGP